MFTKYAACLYARECETYVYRNYVSEQLRLRSEGKYIPTRLTDLLHPPKDYDADQVVADLVHRMGLEVI